MSRRLPGSFSEASFRNVWKESRDRSTSRPGSPGIDRISAQTFSSRLPDNILHVRDLIRRGRYQFARLRVAPIPKATGGERIIAIPTVQDRLVQRVVLAHLEGDKRFPRPSPISFGFTKGRKLSDAHGRALELRQQHPWALQTDIIKFFDNIDRRLVRDRVRRSVKSKIAIELIELAIDCELDDRDPKARSLAIEHTIRNGRGLRQGMPLSPLLSNLLLRSFDHAIASAGLHAVRYADDLAVFCDSKEECRVALDLLRDQLRTLKLEIPELADDTKTQIAGPTDSVEFLGADIKWHEEGYRLCVPFRRLTKIEERLRSVCSVEYCMEHRVTFPQMLATIESSVIGHVRSVSGLGDADAFIQRLQSLQRQYSEALLVSIIGEKAVRGLTDEKRAVLGLASFS